MSNWFDVDKAGLKKVQSEKDKFFIIQELISNALDENINSINVELIKDKTNGSSRTYKLSVKDDSPDGFKNLSHAYTMFADSYKKGNVKQRGRFNLGEKLALAMFKNAQIISTKGSVLFSEKGRTTNRCKTKSGTTFIGRLTLTYDECQSMLNKAKDIIVPKGITLKVNNLHIDRCDDVIKTFKTFLPTIISDADGNLTKTVRETVVEIYPKSRNQGMIYELGIPVVESDVDYDINVMQKIPLNKDRDNVTPAYNKKLCAEVLNHCHNYLTEEQVKHGWVTTALEQADSKAVADVISKKHGEDAVVYDLKDTEANKKAFADSREIIHGGSYNSKVWENIRTVSKNTDLFKSAGQYPQYAKPKFGGGAKPVERTEKINEVVDYAKDMFFKLFTAELNVSVHDGSGASATFCRATNGLSLFYNVLGKKWFDLENNKEKILSLLIHEFAHYIESDHLSKNFHDACCDIGAKWFMLNEKDSRLC